MKYFKYASIVAFVASFIVGLLFLSFYKETKKIVHVYPTPENITKYIFQDDTDNCFLLNSEEIVCPQNKSLIFNTPIQTNQ